MKVRERKCAVVCFKCHIPECRWCAVGHLGTCDVCGRETLVTFCYVTWDREATQDEVDKLTGSAST